MEEDTEEALTEPESQALHVEDKEVEAYDQILLTVLMLDSMLEENYRNKRTMIVI
jgi:hypothetical protein